MTALDFNRGDFSVSPSLKKIVGVVPNSLQDIGRASDEAKARRSRRLGRSVAESEAGPSGRTRAHTGGAEPPAVRYIYHC
jgi:hypothetical protein